MCNYFKVTLVLLLADLDFFIKTPQMLPIPKQFTKIQFIDIIEK